MRLILLYAAQVAFIVAGFAAVSSVFVSINSDAMSSTVTQLLSSTATLATAQALAPLEKFSVQVLAYADMFLANPALQCSDPTSMEWTPEDISQSANPSYVTKPDFRATPGKMIKMAFLRNNLLAEYVYETMQMPRNASQLTDCGVGRQGGFGYAYEFFSPSFHHSGVTTSNDLVNCYVNTSETDGRLNSQFVLPGYYCSQDPDFNEVPHDFEIAARALTRNDSATGKWTIFTTFLDQQGITTTQLMTFGVPLSFSTPDPVTGAYHCTNAATMDLNAQYLTDALHGEVIAGVELAMFWDLKESLVSWTLTTPSSDPTTGALLSAGATGTLFDDAVTAFHDAGWCSGSAQLSGCVSPSDGSSVSSSRYVFALRRVVHINARFTIVISGDRDTFFGPGERARAVGIGVSVAVCVVCLATSVMLWLTTVRPLRRLISNMELASTFSSDVDAEGDSCITEVNEANVAFLSMHEQLQMAKPFMPQHLLEQFEDARRDPVNHFDSSDQNTTVTTNDDDARTVASNTRRSRAATHRSSGDSRGIATVVLESRLVAVLVINITAFDKLIRGSSAADIQVNYAKFIDVVLQVAKAHRGVLDSAQGDHIIVSFNTTLKCAAPASKAVNAAFLIRDALKAFPAAWQRITCGVSVGRAHCGTLGSHEFKSHATLGTVVRQAVGLQRVARALDDQRREGATSGCNDVSVAPGWCVGTARVVQDCATFAHFRYEAVASLPPSGRTTVIASIFPASISDQSLSRHPAGGNLIDNAAEWLYEVGVASTTNPHVEHNMQVQSRFANQNLSNLGHQEATGALTRSSAIVALAHTVHTLTLPLLYDA